MADDDWWHTDKEWRETLDLARGLGWSCKKTSNHNIRHLVCPQGVCKQLVYSTGNGTENVARGTRGKVRGCPHRNVTSPLVVIGELLGNAERFLTAAEALMDHDIADRRMAAAVELADYADDLISEAERELDKVSAEADEDDELTAEIERKLGEAMDKHDRGKKVRAEASDAFDAAAEQQQIAEQLVAKTLQPAEQGVGPADLIRSARSGLRRVDLDLRALPPRNSEVVAMSERMTELKTKCETLRQRLTV